MEPNTENTTMGEAFVRAGIETPTNKIWRLMREAIVSRHLGPNTVVEKFNEIMVEEDSAELERALISSHIREAEIQRLYRLVCETLRAEGVKVSVGRSDGFLLPKGQRNGSERPAERKATSGGVYVNVPKGQSALSPPPSPKFVPTPTRPSYGGVTRVGQQFILDSITVDGIPLRRAEVAKARVWGERREFEGRLVSMMLVNVPDQGLVGDHVTDADAEQMREYLERDRDA